MKKLFRTVSTILALCAMAALLSACATDPNKKTARVIAGAGKGYSAGIGQNAVTQMYELALKNIDACAMVVPVIYQVNSNGVSVTVPDAVLSAEYGGKATFFGSGSSTYTIAVGPGATATLLGGAHVPINSPYWTNSAVGLSQTGLPQATPPTASTVSTNAAAAAAPAAAAAAVKPIRASK